MPEYSVSRAARILLSVSAILAGYIVLILLTTAVQEGLFGGVSFVESSVAELVAAGLLTPLAAVAAGATTAWIARRRPLLHVLPMTIAIVVETSALYRSGRVDGPLWFEALAAAALVAGALAGAAAIAYIFEKKNSNY